MQTTIVSINNLQDAKNWIAKTGADPYAFGIMAQKSIFKTVYVQGIDNRAANILKQEMLSVGAEASINANVSRFKNGTSNVLLMGTIKHFEIIYLKLAKDPFGLKELAENIRSAISNAQLNSFELSLPNSKLELSKTLVMGVLNVTPDSFSGQSFMPKVDDAVAFGIKLAKDGADIIDIGGESSRPGAKPISLKEELNRVITVIEKLVKKVKIPISIDTYKPEVASAALSAGVSIINDITALRYQKGAMAKVASAKGAPVVLMHMRGTPATMQKQTNYSDVIIDICAFLKERIVFCQENGISKNKIILDPGFGFGKTIAQNIEILSNFNIFNSFGLPVLAGTSNKSFIGAVTCVKEPQKRVVGSIASFVIAVMNGAKIIRAHNVLEAKEAIKLADAIKHAGDKES